MLPLEKSCQFEGKIWRYHLLVSTVGITCSICPSRYSWRFAVTASSFAAIITCSLLQLPDCFSKPQPHRQFSVSDSGHANLQDCLPGPLVFECSLRWPHGPSLKSKLEQVSKREPAQNRALMVWWQLVAQVWRRACVRMLKKVQSSLQTGNHGRALHKFVSLKFQP